MTHLDRLNKLPPIFCRYMARTKNGYRGLTTAEIAKASGLSHTTVKELTYRIAWDRVTNIVTVKFMEACGISLSNARCHRRHFRRRKMIHVENAKGHSKQMYEKMERIIIEAAKQRTTENV